MGIYKMQKNNSFIGMGFFYSSRKVSTMNVINKYVGYSLWIFILCPAILYELLNFY